MTDCSCKFKASLGLLALCDRHWLIFDAACADGSVMDGLIALAESEASQ